MARSSLEAPLAVLISGPGKLIRLSSGAKWLQAIQAGDLAPDTLVTIERGGAREGPLPAHSVPELIILFEREGLMPAAEPEEPEPPADPAPAADAAEGADDGPSEEVEANSASDQPPVQASVFSGISDSSLAATPPPAAISPPARDELTVIALPTPSPTPEPPRRTPEPPLVQPSGRPKSTILIVSSAVLVLLLVGVWMFVRPAPASKAPGSDVLSRMKVVVEDPAKTSAAAAPTDLLPTVPPGQEQATPAPEAIEPTVVDEAEPEPPARATTQASRPTKPPTQTQSTQPFPGASATPSPRPERSQPSEVFAPAPRAAAPRPDWCINPQRPLNATETVVCSDDRLARLDMEMSRLFRQQTDGLPTSEYFKLRKVQRDFLRLRDDCGVDRYCIDQRVRQRISELRGD